MGKENQEGVDEAAKVDQKAAAGALVEDIGHAVLRYLASHGVEATSQGEIAPSSKLVTPEENIEEVSVQEVGRKETQYDSKRLPPVSADLKKGGKHHWRRRKAVVSGVVLSVAGGATGITALLPVPMEPKEILEHSRMEMGQLIGAKGQSMEKECEHAVKIQLRDPGTFRNERGTFTSLAHKSTDDHAFDYNMWYSSIFTYTRNAEMASCGFNKKGELVHRPFINNM